MSRRQRRRRCSLGLVAGVSAAGVLAGVASAADRAFTFTYAATVTGLRPRESARVWVPVPPTDETQTVERVSADWPPSTTVTVEPRFGNAIASFALAADHGPSASFAVTYRVTRREVAAPAGRCPVPAAAAMCDPAALLRPDAKVPVGGRPAELLAGRTLPADPTALAKVLYDVVDDRLQYRKDRPGWGTGDATWACESRFGNCTDFHSLFISLARSERLPAVFQIGFPIGRGPGGTVAGYHCWAWAGAGDRWLPVDVSEANQHPDRRAYYFGHLDADRVAFTVGRDLDLVPKQAGPPLNFFVYPYVEVAGLPVPQGGIVKTFSYQSAR